MFFTGKKYLAFSNSKINKLQFSSCIGSAQFTVMYARIYCLLIQMGCVAVLFGFFSLCTHILVHFLVFSTTSYIV